MQERYQTIRQVGRNPQWPREWVLRQLQKQGKLPGFMSASRFYIDVFELGEALAELGAEQRRGGQ